MGDLSISQVSARPGRIGIRARQMFDDTGFSVVRAGRGRGWSDQRGRFCWFRLPRYEPG